ncbi:MAG: hypothetical protein HQL53_03025 [Magnetococcales bacterium]|nr:hypothetical protein [Magnetococcales bacterium]
MTPRISPSAAETGTARAALPTLLRLLGVLGLLLTLNGCFFISRHDHPITDVELEIAAERTPETYTRTQLIRKFRTLFQTKCLRGLIICTTRIAGVTDSHFDVVIREEKGHGDLHVGFVRNFQRRVLRVPFGSRPILYVAGEAYRIDVDGRPFLVHGRREALNIYSLLNQISETPPEKRHDHAGSVESKSIAGSI